MHKVILLFLFVGLLGGTVWLWTSAADTAAEVDTAVETVEVAPVPVVPAFDIETYTITSEDVFTTAMDALGIGYAEALEIVDVASSTFDFTRIREGKEFKLYSKDGAVKKLVYEPDRERAIIVTFNPIEVVEEEIVYDVTEAHARATIDSSLFLAGAEAGLSDALILDIADVFAWTIDFATQVQVGDSFRVLYEKRSRDGQDAGHGDILTAEFVNSGKSYFAYQFEDAEGKVQYYDEDGNSLIKQFLKAPLTYSRITSGFTNARFHPVLQRNTPHRAIDYAAPVGTPVLSVGDGTIVFAGWSGGYGNFVKVRHNSTYQTHYAHLSRIAVSHGQVVEQGQVIGYVGSTGFSTGPHLHYEIQKNGTLVNPLQIELPAGDPVEEDRRAAFEARKNELHPKLMQE